MDEKIKEGDILNINKHENGVHVILAHSYVVYFSMFLVGTLLDLIFKIKILNYSFMIPVGVVLFLFSSFLIFWAQKTSRNFKKENLTKESFTKGPYSITRCPTHWGLFLLILGFGFMTNAIFIVISSVISFIITKFIYLNHEEEVLEKKYGEPYREYKKSVRI